MHFVSLFCPHILSFVSCINFIPLWDQYTDSIVPPPMCLFGAMSDNLSSQSSVNILSSLISTSGSLALSIIGIWQ